jgi:hypothetical protein
MELIDFKEQYKQDLKDPRWKAMVRRIRYRDNDRCRICGCKKRTGMEMNVHHIHYYPNRKPWEYDESDLITLCRDCHIKEHDRINFEKLERGSYFYHKYHEGVGIVTRKYSDRIWFGLCWSETESYEGEDHGRLYIEDDAYISDIRPATRVEIADFWRKVKKYYTPDEINDLFHMHIKTLLPSNAPVDCKVLDVLKKSVSKYNSQKEYVKNKFGSFLLVSNEYYAEFDDKCWKGHIDWSLPSFPNAYFHVANKKRIMECPQQDIIKDVAFDNFDFSEFRAATAGELDKWLDYILGFDC